MKYKLILMFIFSFLVHIAIAGALVYVPYHIYSVSHKDSHEGVIWGDIQVTGGGKQGAGSRSKRTGNWSQKSEEGIQSPEKQPADMQIDRTDEQIPHPASMPLREESHPASLELPGQEEPFPFLTGGAAGGTVQLVSKSGSNAGGDDLMGNAAKGRDNLISQGTTNKGANYQNQPDMLIGQVRNEIEKNKYYPLLAKLRGVEGTVYINFHISRDGRAGSVAILKSSGSKVLDESAVKTIMNLKSFRNINAGLRELDITVPISYRLQENS